MRRTGKTALALVTISLASGLLSNLGPAWRFVEASLEQAQRAGLSVMSPALGANRREGAPVANAGLDRAASLGDIVVLDGSRSLSATGARLTYKWRIARRPAGSLAFLDDPAAVKPTLVVDLPGDYVVRLQVSDGVLTSAPDRVTISTNNVAPVADAGLNRAVVVGDEVLLDASGSTDFDGDPLSYSWSLVEKPAGSVAILDDPTALRAAFFVDLTGTYVAELTVSDGESTSDPVHVLLSTGNLAPVAEAGPAGTAEVDAEVHLDPAGTSDVNRDWLSGSWALLASPPASISELDTNFGERPRLMLDEPGTYVVQLKVEDGTAPAAFDTVVISTDNSPPVAHAGPDQAVALGQEVRLDGTGSSDVDGDFLAHRWALISAPAGSDAVLDNPASVDPTFTVDAVGTYVAQLIVDDGIEPSLPDTIVLTTENVVPVANADVDPVAGAGLVLDGSRSHDADGDPLTYRWALLGFGDDGEASDLSLDSAEAVAPSLTWHGDTARLVQLVVNDGFADSAPATLFISSENTRPVADAGEDLQVPPGLVVALDGTGSTDLDHDPLTFRWAMLAKPEGSAGALSDPTARQPALTADVPGKYVIQLIVSDGTLDSLPDTVTVAVTGGSLANTTLEEPAAAQNALPPIPTASIALGTTMASSSEPSTTDDERRDMSTLSESGTLAPLALSAAVPAFPGCEGSGCGSLGGRGGAVCNVTSTADTGGSPTLVTSGIYTGTLRQCVQNLSIPRTVVFRTGGTIRLNSQLSVSAGRLTVAGQTAPGGGIQISGAGMEQEEAVVHTFAPDVVWRYTRIRKGHDDFCSVNTEPGCGANFVIDNGSHRIVLDHNSLQWNTDEGLSIWTNGGSQLSDITVSWNIIAEPLSGIAHDTAILMGSGIGSRNTDFHHNYLANTGYRTPLVKDNSGGGRYVNNILYNWRRFGPHFRAGDWDLISNEHKCGPGGFPGACGDSSHRCSYGIDPNNVSSVYLQGNIGRESQNPANNNWATLACPITSDSGSHGAYGGVPSNARRLTPLAETEWPITTFVATELDTQVLPIVGASQKLACDGSLTLNRDAVDTAIVNNYLNVTGRHSIHRETDPAHGGYPTLAAGTPCVDSDLDGMPDVWEIAQGLNPSNPADRNSDLNADGYTALEEFLRGRSAGGAPADTTNPTVAVTSPSNGATVSGTITLSASASDDVGVAGVQFKIDGTTVGFEDTTAPYSISLDTTILINGNHTITAVARDAAGNSATSAGITIAVTAPAPTASLSAAPTSISAGESSTLSWSSTDATSCTGTNFSTGGALSGTRSVSPSADTTYTLACLGAGGNASNSATVRVTAPAPTACAATVLNVSSAGSDGGSAWLLRGNYGTPADNSSNPRRSTLRLFENGKELGPAHSPHVDIRNLGRGRFSHWSNRDGSGEALRFASADNSNPRNNGRTYAVCIGGSTTTAARR